MPHSPYLGRLAPSPTGFLHLGHAATFLAAADRAHAAGGTNLLRMDDLDTQRVRTLYAEAAREDLRWLGISWTAEVQQTARLPRYRQAMQQMLATGLVYPCSCSRKDLLEAVQAPHEDTDDEPIYSGRCRPSEGSPQAGGDVLLASNYRFRVPATESVHFLDGNLGDQHFTAGVDFGDFVVWRKDDLPSYQLASVVDDADLGITEVVRGRDLLKSTARQILLWRALGRPVPAFFHTELLRDSEGVRLAKRHDALSLRALRASGVTPAEIRARTVEPLHQTNRSLTP